MKNKYFSGQGMVSLEAEGEKHDLGNCTDLIFYDDSTFDLVWESLSKQNIELLLGKHVGIEANITDGVNVVYDKYEIKTNTERNYTLHFNGVNTTYKNEPIQVRVPVTIGIPSTSLSFINDGLASYLTTGKWKTPLQILIPASITSEQDEMVVSQGVLRNKAEKPATKIVRLGDFIKILKLKDDWYHLTHCINVNAIQKIDVSTVVLNVSHIHLLDGDVIDVDCNIETLANAITKPNSVDISLARHKESISGKRLEDAIYTRGKENRILVNYKR